MQQLANSTEASQYQPTMLYKLNCMILIFFFFFRKHQNQSRWMLILQKMAKIELPKDIFGINV